MFNNIQFVDYSNSLIYCSIHHHPVITHRTTTEMFFFLYMIRRPTTGVTNIRTDLSTEPFNERSMNDTIFLRFAFKSQSISHTVPSFFHFHFSIFILWIFLIHPKEMKIDERTSASFISYFCVQYKIFYVLIFKHISVNHLTEFFRSFLKILNKIIYVTRSLLHEDFIIYFGTIPKKIKLCSKKARKIL